MFIFFVSAAPAPVEESLDQQAENAGKRAKVLVSEALSSWCMSLKLLVSESLTQAENAGKRSKVLVSEALRY